MRLPKQVAHAKSHAPAYATLLADVDPASITTRAALTAELERVRAEGIAVNNEELAYGLRSIAVPVLAASGEAVAAVNLAAHSAMVSIDDLVERLGPTIRQAAGEISAQLGYRSPTEA